jgi:hypothetical protein
MSTNVEFDDVADSYRSLSRPAIFSVLCGLFSLFGFLFTSAVVFSVIGMGLGALAIVGIRKYPEELTGVKLAKFGILFSLLSFCTFTSFHTYHYLTEVPEDHQRLTFYEIKSPKHRKYIPTERAMELNGKKVFMKGYTFPGKSKKNLSKFLMVGDFGLCCFGGDPQPTHSVKVSFKNGQKIDYSQRVRKLTGTFRVLDHLGQDETKTGYIYELEADTVQ